MTLLRDTPYREQQPMPVPADSYLHEFLFSELADVVGPENVSTSQSDKIAYSCDFFWIPELWVDRGCCSPQPDFVVHPRSTEEVSRICRIASNYKIPLTPWGGGSGSQGGALPIQGGIVLDTKKLNRILDIDKTSLTLTTETGIIMQHLELSGKMARRVLEEAASTGAEVLTTACPATLTLLQKANHTQLKVRDLVEVAADAVVGPAAAAPPWASKVSGL